MLRMAQNRAQRSDLFARLRKLMDARDRSCAEAARGVVQMVRA